MRDSSSRLKRSEQNNMEEEQLLYSEESKRREIHFVSFPTQRVV